MIFQTAIKRLPVTEKGEFLVIGHWRFYKKYNVATHEYTGERFKCGSWEEFVIEKRLLEKFFPEYQMCREE